MTTPRGGGKFRVPLAQAERIAAEALALLAPACRRIEIAGSIRRRRREVADVELVAVPILEPTQLDLWGATTRERDLLHDLCDLLLADGVLAHRPDTNGRRAFGPRFKRLVYEGHAGGAGTLPLDLFVVTPPAQFGAVLAVRTGPAEYSHRLVTPRQHGGGMPAGMRLEAGALWDGGRVVETPEERDFFAALGLVWLPPEQRTDDSRLVRSTA
jgi:DNA polymerase/3'-5' exonuclease PolX